MCAGTDQPRHEKDANRQNSVDRGMINPVCNCPGVVRLSGRDGMSKYAHNFDKNNFGPRVGFALRLDQATVLRGGGAVVYTGQYDQATPIVASLGFSIRAEFVSTNGGVTPAFLLRDTCRHRCRVLRTLPGAGSRGCRRFSRFSGRGSRGGWGGTCLLSARWGG